MKKIILLCSLISAHNTTYPVYKLPTHFLPSYSPSPELHTELEYNEESADFYPTEQCKSKCVQRVCIAMCVTLLAGAGWLATQNLKFFVH